MIELVATAAISTEAGDQENPDQPTAGIISAKQTETAVAVTISVSVASAAAAVSVTEEEKQDNPNPAVAPATIISSVHSTLAGIIASAVSSS